MSVEKRQTVCDICLANCGVDAWVEDGKIIRLEGSPDCKNQGRLCCKGYSNLEYITRPDRLPTPMRRVGRRGAGKFEPISWEEALAETARRLNQIKAESGAESVAFYTGYTKWYRTIFHRLASSFGSPNYITESSVCFQAVLLTGLLNAGALSKPDIANTGLLLAWGFNPYYSNVPPYGQLEKLKARGVPILCIDPRLTPVAKLADIYLQIKAGTDGALALFFGNYLIQQGAVDHDYIAAHVHGFAAYRDYVRSFSLERAAQTTGEAPEKIMAAARILASSARPIAISEGSAPLVHHKNGVQNLRAVMALSALTGSYDRKGGNLPTEYAVEALNHPRAGDAEFLRAVEPEGVPRGVGMERFPVWGEFMDECQGVDLARQVLEGAPYPIRAIFALGMNARMFPNDREMFRALEQVEFFVDTDLFLTDTGKYADILLPACSSFERTQYQTAYKGSYHATPNARCVEPVIPPLHQSRSDADILCDLAVHLGLDDPILTAGYDACAREILKETGLTPELLKATHATTPIPGAKPYRPGANTESGYRTPTGKFELYSTVLEKHGFDPLPTYASSLDGADPDRYPLQLTSGGRLPWEFHSRFQPSRLREHFRPAPLVDVHPTDAAQRGIRQGDPVYLETPQGTLSLRANVTRMACPGCVFLYQDNPKADANSLLPPGHLDPISGFPGYNSLRCQLRAAPQEGGGDR